MADYRKALAALSQFADYERTVPSAQDLNLSNVRHLLSLLGSPHHAWRSIHVAGTKGKGSTCALIASILKATGCRVGLYTSPHLTDLRERIQIDGQWVSEEDFAQGLEAVLAVVPQLSSPPTYFEILTAAAFLIFKRCGVEVAVVEVGLGGRLDATNLLDPDVAVITPVSFDHTQILGNSLSAIAREKAGIIKPGRPVVVAPQSPEALEEILEAADSCGSLMVHVKEQTPWEIVSQSWQSQRVRLWTRLGNFEADLPLVGDHQAANFAAAVTALLMFSDASGAAISIDAIQKGAQQVSWPGRFQIVGQKPWVILDGAHNAASAEVLVKTIRSLRPTGSLCWVVGISADKDVEGLAAALGKISKNFIATEAPTPRTLKAPDLARRIQSVFPDAQAEPDLLRAVEIAKNRVGPDGCVVVTGSLYLVGQILKEEICCHG